MTSRADERQLHWDDVYTAKAETEVSWFQDSPDISLDLIRATGAPLSAAIVDAGGGASRLVDGLLDRGYTDLTVLDLSQAALEKSKARLGARAANVTWLVGDVTQWAPDKTYDIWHDRAAFHFLTDAADRARYAERVAKALKPDGHVIIGTFAPDGPERCSGLPVQRHDAASLGAVLGPSFVLEETRRHDHPTPFGTVQRFQFSRFRRNA